MVLEAGYYLMKKNLKYKNELIRSMSFLAKNKKQFFLVNRLSILVMQFLIL